MKRRVPIPRTMSEERNHLPQGCRDGLGMTRVEARANRLSHASPPLDRCVSCDTPRCAGAEQCLGSPSLYVETREYRAAELTEGVCSGCPAVSPLPLLANDSSFRQKLRVDIYTRDARQRLVPRSHAVKPCCLGQDSPEAASTTEN